MTDVENLTVQILREIRDEIRTTRVDLGSKIDQTNSRLDQTNSRLDQTNNRIDQTNSRLDLVEGTLLDLAKQQRFLVRNAKRSTIRETKFIQDVDELRGRLDELESRLPPKTS